MDAEIKKGSLNEKYDVIILPDDSTAAHHRRAPTRPRRAAARPTTPSRPSTAAASATKGVTALKAFVEKGGTLVTLGGAGNFAIEKLGLPRAQRARRQDVQGVLVPGLHAQGEVRQRPTRSAYGMPAEGLVASTWPAARRSRSCPASTTSGTRSSRATPIATCSQSGWLIGEEMLAKKAAMVSAKVGEGEVVLIGFRAQHRAQTHGTFKLLFNALVR